MIRSLFYSASPPPSLLRGRVSDIIRGAGGRCMGPLMKANKPLKNESVVVVLSILVHQEHGVQGPVKKSNWNVVHDAWNSTFRLEKDMEWFEDSCWLIFLFFWLKLDEYTTAMRGECGKQDYLWMIDKHLCQRMTDKHDHLHMTAKHDHSGQTLTNNNSVTLSAYIMIISFRPFSLVKYRGPPK